MTTADATARDIALNRGKYRYLAIIPLDREGMIPREVPVSGNHQSTAAKKIVRYFKPNFPFTLWLTNSGLERIDYWLYTRRGTVLVP